MFSSIFKVLTIDCKKQEDKNEGWSVLHNVAYSSDADTLEKTIHSLGSQASSLAKKFTHDTNQLPLELIEQNPNYKKDKDKLRVLLEPLTEGVRLSPLTQKLNTKEIKQLYPSLKTHSNLYKNLRSAYVIINEVRNHIKISTTHTDYNALSLDEKNSWKRTVKTMRDIRLGKEKNVSGIGLLELYVEGVLTYQAGNCGEAAYFALYELQRRAPHVQGELYEYVNGDHLFLVIGRDPASESTDYKTWGNAAVVCDPWGGYAMPASEIPQKLTCYFNYAAGNKNIILPFDPEHHKLRMTFSLPTKSMHTKDQNPRFFKVDKKNLSTAEKASVKAPVAGVG